MPEIQGTLTLPCRSLPARNAEPSEVERKDVSAGLQLSRDMKRIGACRLLTAALNWENFTVSPEVPGAPEPTVAKASLTRDSRRRWELARQARSRQVRGGVTRAFLLAKAISA